MPLPADLRSAERDAQQALQAALAQQENGRWTAEFRFEGLKLLPLALRWLQTRLEEPDPGLLLLPDAGAAALARRDAPDLATRISTLREERERQKGGSPCNGLLIAVGPDPSDYELMQEVCEAHPGSVLMLNGRLEDAAVGIGSVARERRKGFISTWSSAYTLQPLAGGALQHCLPADWEIYRQDPDGYRLVATAQERPDSEAIGTALDPGGSGGLAAGLKAVDRFLGALQS
ncbi:DUF1995 family protein [Synechococcus sp. RSCCF101]|uniref:DUF1995 family protein n=1 Tax=Synechococcus sp. RSCCF101 TaxID=2511069 RepID=UPI0012460160|nr:DUF1995 family protein [Synechococcus sp. RSCCF101]QEY31716.1 DUF1995 family protein [Synechococcus sp. RSCCF101]